jgi:hypothetical protein
MGDAAVVVVLLVVIGLVAWPRARLWLRSGQSSPPVDPDQNITVDPVDGLVGIYQTNYHPRRMARGRRHPAPPGAVVHRRPPEDPPKTTRD